MPENRQADPKAGLITLGAAAAYRLRRTISETAPKTSKAPAAGSGTANGAKVATLTELELMIAAKLFWKLVALV